MYMATLLKIEIEVQSFNLMYIDAPRQIPMVLV